MTPTTESLGALTRQMQKVVVIGAGPAGLTAAYELGKAGVRSQVLEATGVIGGISQTASYKGYLFDIGGHRFFTKVGIVNRIWKEILAEDFLSRPRLSRIFYKGKFFSYPLEPMNAFLGLGPWETLRCVASFAWARVTPVRPEDDFATWVRNRFGERLFKIFFESYTEKVWGIPCAKIKSDWGAQRIKGLSLWSAIKNAFTPKGWSGKKIKTLIHEFEYPRRGPGMMWETAAERIAGQGSELAMNAPVEEVHWEPGRVTRVVAGGRTYEGTHFISSMPLQHLLRALRPQPEWAAQAAEDFHYRDFLTVALVIRSENLFPDNWIYIHDPRVQVGRIQNYKNWSPEMVPDPSMTCLGLEYFCFEGDGLWNKSDEELVRQAREEIAVLGLARAEDVQDGTVVRMPKAYPIYDDTYERGISAVREFLDATPNLQVVGRNGMHRYNNQDHSMLTAVLAARNVLGDNYDLWRVNADEEYHEAGAGIEESDFAELRRTQPLVPQKVHTPPALRPEREAAQVN